MAEFTLAVTLLAGAGLALHSFWNLSKVDLGVETDHVLVFGLSMPKDASPTPEQIMAHYRDVLSSVQSAPGVESAAAVTGLPLQGTAFGMPFTIVGQPDYADRSQRPGAGFEMITPAYFKTFGIRVVQGRTFTDDDNAGSLHVAMVNEEFVRHYFPGKNPLGQHLMVEQLIPGETELGPAQSWEIVGVFHDVRGGGFRRQFPEIDVPFYQSPWVGANFGVRTAGDPAAMKRTIAAAVHSVDPHAALQQLQTLDQVREDDLAGDRFSLLLYASFAAIALALAALGIYGVMAFSVGQRSHEIGVRMALGASRDHVVRMVLREGAMLAGAGLLLGLGGAYLVGRAMRSTLFGVGAIDPGAFLSVAALLLLAALAACYLPARRASRIEPMRALRTE